MNKKVNIRGIRTRIVYNISKIIYIYSQILKLENSQKYFLQQKVCPLTHRNEIFVSIGTTFDTNQKINIIL